ncbi:MAG: multiubiquitin domain-containing protein [Flavobacteriaceae bacterium]|nr:multiubiquitin domain-containing protein [Flavobacteriaceae bacterium]MBL4568771.1 multiubiquitin domain-containing protein [Flavobacteriaceae bacterium]
MSKLDNKKELSFIVNGVSHSSTQKSLSYMDIVTLGFGSSNGGANIIFTVSYRKGHSNDQEDTLDPDGSVRIKEGMIFNVTKTDKS